MKNVLFVILILFTMCKSKNEKKASASPFSGSYRGTHAGYPSTADINTNANNITGTLTMNGFNATLSGSVNGTASSGIITDPADNKQYQYTGTINGGLLKLSISSPDNPTEIVELIMNRSNITENNSTPTPSSKQLDADLIGEWVNTGILGAGTEFSMTNETLMEFLNDGTFSSWPGRSAGPDYSREEEKHKATQGKWYTEDNKLHFIDPSTNEDVATNYTLSPNGLLLYNEGKEKKLFQRR
jgi:hypothetical protein